MAFTYRPAALLFRITAVGVIATGLVRLVDVFGDEPGWSALLFYTGQSNVLCLVWMAIMAAVTVRDLGRDGTRGLSSPWPRLSAAVMMAITVTMLVYLVLLAPEAFQQSGGDYRPFGLTDNLVHIITPCLIIADWLWWAPKGRLRVHDPLLWAIPPYAYLGWAFAFSASGGMFGPDRRSPYPFMDVDLHGVGGVAAWIAAITVALVTFGFVYLGLDRALARRQGATHHDDAGPRPRGGAHRDTTPRVG